MQLSKRRGWVLVYLLSAYNRGSHCRSTPVTPLRIPEETVHLSVELTDLEKEVLEEIERDSGISKIRIAEKIGKSDRTVQRCLASLQTKGFLKRIGGTRWHWEVALFSTIDH